MTGHRARSVGEGEYLPSYPRFTGSEPCATIGAQFYYDEDKDSTKQKLAHIPVLEAACATCPLRAECLEWALYRERYGYWAGTTKTERERMRHDMGIRVVEPQYSFFDWEISHEQLPA